MSRIILPIGHSSVANALSIKAVFLKIFAENGDGSKTILQTFYCFIFRPQIMEEENHNLCCVFFQTLPNLQFTPFSW